MNRLHSSAEIRMVRHRDPARVSDAERALAAAARRALRLPAPILRLLSGGRARVLDDHVLDPEMQFLTAARNRMGGQSLQQADVEESRWFQRHEAFVFGGVPVPVGAVRELTIPGASGPLLARHYAPDDGGGRPLLVYFHGGGFVMGDLDTHDAPCRALCREADVHVLSVAYRLAPEHVFPAAVDDGYAAFRWARANAATLGADPTRVAVGGDSAGGNIAAVVALDAARLKEPAPALQLLLYPATDRTRRWRSEDLFSEGLVLTREDVAWFARTYKPDGGWDHPRFSPLRAGDLSGLAPAIVITAGFDPLRDEGEAYAKALTRAENHVLLRREGGLVHGFMNMAIVSPSAERAVTRVAVDLREALG